MKVLFILKYRNNYGCNTISLSSGLKNSIEMLVGMINKLNPFAEAKYSVVVDNNSIDREVHQYKPDIVVIEAFWVVPDKFDILKKLHPNVKWIVRNHSKTEFLANEGIAFDWLKKYIEKGIIVACNSLDAANDFKDIIDLEHRNSIEYLPNYYPVIVGQNIHKLKFGTYTNIGCFGAIRPLKNQLNQAVAVVKFAEETGQRIKFHINSTRIEGKSESILKNIRNVLGYSNKCILVEHEWMEHDDFLEVVSKMDINLQVSFSETFNIVAADSISMGVPIIVSEYVDWLKFPNISCEIGANAIKESIKRIWSSPSFMNTSRVIVQQLCLSGYSMKAESIWRNFIGR